MRLENRMAPRTPRAARRLAGSLLALALALAGSSEGSAEAVQETPRTLPETVRARLAEVDAIAGTDPLLRALRNYHCYYVDPVAAPFRPSVMDETDFLYGTPVLDDVYYLGYLNLAVYAIRTSEGLVLVDGGGTAAQGQRILDWMASAGFAPSDLRWIILTHEHADHIAGAQVLRAATGARIAVSAAMLTNGQMPDGLGTPDLAVSARQELQVGTRQLVLLPTPGHTPGTLSLFAPVHAEGQAHMAAFWGGKGMRPSPENLRTMLASLDAFRAEAERLGADVPLNTHGWGDATISRLVDSILAPGLPNRFVLSPARNAANLEMLRLCTEAYLDKVVAEQNAGAPPRES
ncbi:MBL fold metallo-hydrolase [Novosphingobium mangrovi (ex Hu et al. 2023)]|uniref:MBL fold metallo-hydrolase n=1 Tax=Novosphingobium mangrovi (ex Hu et al. 2023) TaxID=2930094 RepID=A0ABT0ADY3_9SPHN|nr:MBL fold metallo-hydrolase [Novosphingobium mangrovi (ex Hu et al. 2023)]MCJ1961408.1 MBL fold metallo-hydrolase [Novosphingobium mangrovi (ex Hu et al. 2023)]